MHEKTCKCKQLIFMTAAPAPVLACDKERDAIMKDQEDDLRLDAVPAGMAPGDEQQRTA